ncbi:class I SAM-dependent methyltransferase [Candidatus Phycosocius spiralis]|uniref:Ubiquinone/menaquinone biosynthesis C-methyltransferase UbiE n=1 Tax=Candidatus Phycosocius spiralis TaxID=2815099 RepID=A0ABQ4PTE6_9PROT|nr:class I SAM-dependent methyltransferase [Candidatus Phycosocius spiralis]GIU66292.1 ubiquinone/menaquinone biosynthesis C-methyltransferase UbiE [Candidatus Phycosocius spiralis]
MAKTAETQSNTASFGFQDVPAHEKATRVRGVFDAVASRYDLMNDLMSAGMHRAWKDAVAARLNPRPGERILDLAGGTGDLARRFKALADAAGARSQRSKAQKPAEIIVVDINAEMIAAGRERGLDGLGWAVGDAEALPFADNSADGYVISYGIRNVTNIPKALREAYRVLKPGGRFYCLEFSKPTTGALEALYDAWSFKAIPSIGKAVTGNAEPYHYLVESIRRFPDQESFADMISVVGFNRVTYTNFSGGITALHGGWKV